MYDATRGVDVGTKTEIYQLMREQCEKGVGILFYSTDVAELSNIADRVIVLHDGTVRAHLDGADLTERRIIAAVGRRAEGGGLVSETPSETPPSAGSRPSGARRRRARAVARGARPRATCRCSCRTSTCSVSGSPSTCSSRS